MSMVSWKKIEKRAWGNTVKKNEKKHYVNWIRTWYMYQLQSLYILTIRSPAVSSC